MDGQALPRDAGRAILVAGAAVLVLAGLRYASDVIAPILMALVLSVTAYPLQRMLQRRGWPTAAALLTTLVVVYAVLIAFVLLVVVAIEQLAETLPQYTDQLQELVADVSSALGGRGSDGAASQSIDLEAVASFVVDALQGVMGVVGMGVIIVGVVFFLALDSLRFPQTYDAMSESRPHVAEGWSAWAAQTRRYIGVSTVFGLIVATIDTLLLVALDVPLPVLWGLLAFVTNYIPNIGFVIGVIPPALLGLLDGGVSTMLWVIVGYSVINFTIQEFIQPKVIGDTVNLSATLTFISVFFWTFVVGPLGAILCVPLTLFVHQVLLAPYPGTRWLADAIGSKAHGSSDSEPVVEPAPPPAEATPAPAG